MSNRNDDSIPTDDDVKIPGTVPVDDDSLDWGKGSLGTTRGSYLELHGDVHKGQEPPEEKD